MGEESINPNFKTTVFFGMKPLMKDEILNELDNDHSIYCTFKRYGIIHCKQYSFITKITFSPYEKNCVEGAKNEEEKIEASHNIKAVEDYFNSCQQENDEPFKVDFAARKDNECALYNPNRFDYNTLQAKLREIFG